MPIINRAAAEALIETQLTKTIFQDAPKQSTFLSLARKLPNMTSKQTRIPVLDMLPMAYWVNGDTGMKQTSRQAWDNVYLTAAELAVIVPIPEAVLEDASFDIMGEIQPRVMEAIGQRVDEAVLFGINRPVEWQNDIVTLARQAGNNVAASGGLTYDNIMGSGGLISKVEDAGYSVDGVVASMKAKAGLRGLKGSDGHPLYSKDMQGATPYALDGAPMFFPENGSFDTSVAVMIAGNWKQAVYAMRQDITVKLLDQAVIQDPATKEIIFNLAQQDMVAMRVTFRMGWAVPNPATRMNGDRLNVPFAYLEPTTAVTDYAVTFSVKDAASSGTAVSGAVINVNGARKKTNSVGSAVFNLRPGTYEYTAKLDGYRPASGTVTVSGSTATINVVMPAVS